MESASLISLAVAAATVLITPGRAAAPMTVAAHASGEVVERVYSLINQARGQARRCGSEAFPPAPPLAVSTTLQRAAAGHAADMARRNFFEHRGHDGSQPRDRLARLGYRFRLVGENIASGPESAEEVVAGWQASPGHCANIMDARFSATGVAFSIEPRRHAILWVQELAWPR
jgi:uncharacterized protein YkwD